MPSPPRYRATVVRVDLGAVRSNVRLLRARLDADHTILAVLHGNAYGHGATPIARTLAEEGIGWFGVGSTEEGLRLREAGVEARILVLSGFADGSEAVAIEAGLTPVVYRSASVRALNNLAARRGEPVSVHLEVDTGHGGLGVPARELSGFLDLLADLPHLRVEGVLTHLVGTSQADEDPCQRQVARFAECVLEVRARGHEPRFVHAADSAAIMTGRGLASPAETTMVRAGLLLMGVSPDFRLDGAWPLLPALALESAIAYLKPVPEGGGLDGGSAWIAERESQVAAIPIGYADGYPLALGQRAEVLVRGRRAPVIGRVTLDLLLLDVTDVPQVREGDRVVLLGRQGKEEVSALELAALTDAVPHTILASLSPRVPRQYRDLHGPIDIPLLDE